MFGIAFHPGPGFERGTALVVVFLSRPFLVNILVIHLFFEDSDLRVNGRPVIIVKHGVMPHLRLHLFERRDLSLDLFSGGLGSHSVPSSMVRPSALAASVARLSSSV